MKKWTTYDTPKSGFPHWMLPSLRATGQKRPHLDRRHLQKKNTQLIQLHFDFCWLMRPILSLLAIFWISILGQGVSLSHICSTTACNILTLATKKQQKFQQKTIWMFWISISDLMIRSVTHVLASATRSFWITLVAQLMLNVPVLTF